MFIKIPVKIYFEFGRRLPVASREYAALENPILESVPRGDYNVESVCEEIEDAVLLLYLAKRFYPEAAPYVEHALDSASR
jgi:hypothetical protein